MPGKTCQFFFVNTMRLVYDQKNCFFKKRELIYRPMFSINANDPVGDYTALSKKASEK